MRSPLNQSFYRVGIIVRKVEIWTNFCFNHIRKTYFDIGLLCWSKIERWMKRILKTFVLNIRTIIINIECFHSSHSISSYVISFFQVYYSFVPNFNLFPVKILILTRWRPNLQKTNGFVLYGPLNSLIGFKKYQTLELVCLKMFFSCMISFFTLGIIHFWKFFIIVKYGSFSKHSVLKTSHPVFWDC